MSNGNVSRETLEGWQPIATAPKDGSIVDLWVNKRRRSNCYWTFTQDHTGNRLPDGPFDGWCCDESKPAPSGFNPYPNLISGKPTHWMRPEKGPRDA